MRESRRKPRTPDQDLGQPLSTPRTEAEADADLIARVDALHKQLVAVSNLLYPEPHILLAALSMLTVNVSICIAQTLKQWGKVERAEAQQQAFEELLAGMVLTHREQLPKSLALVEVETEIEPSGVVH